MKIIAVCTTETMHRVKKEKRLVPPQNVEALYETITAHKRIGMGG
jgi:hypothetical protein